MSGVWRGLVTLALAVALLAAGGAVGVSAADGASAAQAGDPIVLDQQFGRLPDDPGNVSIELTYSVPDRVVSLRTTIPTNATVLATDGFDRRNATTYAWDERTERPSLTYRYEVNRTAHRTGPEGAHGSYLAADVGDWALFTRPTTPTEFEYTGDRPTFDRRSVIDGEGAAGEWLVYLGPERTFSRSEHNQTFDLVVPEAASMAESPREVLGGLTRAADSLNVGDRDETVFVVAAPTGEVPWAVRGYQTGDADMWVADGEKLTAPENVWYHEYIHTRQAFETAPDAAWLDEGIAAYYATRLTYEHQALSFGGFADQLAKGTGADYADVVLESPETWRGFADYYKGGLAVGYLDRQLRLARADTDGFEAVFARLNDRDRVNASMFRSELERVGDQTVRAEGERITGSTANVSMWNESEHLAAFGRLPATIEYGLAAQDPRPTFQVSGPYRETPITTDSPLEVVAGESLTVRATVENSGGMAGRFEATLRINGTRVDSTAGQLEPNETTTVPLEHRFVIPGRYVISIDGTSVPVRVREPETATVTNVSVDRTVVDQGRTVGIAVAVHNRGTGPAQRELIVTRNFREVARETVYLRGGETKRVTFDVRFPRAGDARVAVNGNWPAEVTVNPAPVETASPTPNGTTATPTATETGADATEGDGPGMGVVAAILALALAVVLARRRQ